MENREENLRKIANMVMNIDHVGAQCDDMHSCEHMHQTILALDKLDRHDAVRLLMHVIHVQQLQIADSTIKIDPTNPFGDMVHFNNIEFYVNSNSPDMETLY